jgi:hypothetical protein
MRVVPMYGEKETRGLMEASPLFPQTARCFFLLLLGTVNMIYIIVAWRKVRDAPTETESCSCKAKSRV